MQMRFMRGTKDKFVMEWSDGGDNGARELGQCYCQWRKDELKIAFIIEGESE